MHHGTGRFRSTHQAGQMIDLAIWDMLQFLLYCDTGRSPMQTYPGSGPGPAQQDVYHSYTLWKCMCLVHYVTIILVPILDTVAFMMWLHLQGESHGQGSIRVSKDPAAQASYCALVHTYASH